LIFDYKIRALFFYDAEIEQKILLPELNVSPICNWEKDTWSGTVFFLKCCRGVKPFEIYISGIIWPSIRYNIPYSISVKNRIKTDCSVTLLSKSA